MADANDWNSKIIEEFRANGGKVGGQFEGAPLLLHTVGAKSGQQRVNPMMYREGRGQRGRVGVQPRQRRRDRQTEIVRRPGLTR